MNISSTRRTPGVRPQPAKLTQAQQEPRLSLVDSMASDPLVSGRKSALIVPTVGGLAVGAALGVIGDGLGAGAAVPGIAALGVVGAAVGSRIDQAVGKDGKTWKRVLSAVGATVGAAGVVAGAVGGAPGAIAGGVSLAATGFALGHLYTHVGR